MNSAGTKILLISSVITTSTPEKSDGLKALENAIDRIKATIEKLDGHFAIQMAVSCLNLPLELEFRLIFALQPKVVTAIDEADLARRMERAEMENAEVSGDEDESENEEGMKFDAGDNSAGEKDSGSEED